MRDYQRKKNNPYRLPHDVWMQTLWVIRSYYRLKDEADSIAELSSVSTEGGRSSMPGDMTASKVIQREKYMRKVSAIDKAKNLIPQEYRAGVWNNIMYGRAFPDDADRTTYSRHKSRFVYHVATFLDIL